MALFHPDEEVEDETDSSPLLQPDVVPTANSVPMPVTVASASVERGAMFAGVRQFASKGIVPLPLQYRQPNPFTVVRNSDTHPPPQMATKQVTPLPAQYREYNPVPVVPTVRSDLPSRRPIRLASKAITPLPPQYRQEDPSYVMPNRPTASLPPRYPRRGPIHVMPTQDTNRPTAATRITRLPSPYRPWVPDIVVPRARYVSEQAVDAMQNLLTNALNQIPPGQQPPMSVNVTGTVTFSGESIDDVMATALQNINALPQYRGRPVSLTGNAAFVPRNGRPLGYATKQVTPLPPQYRSNRTRSPVMPSARVPVLPVRNRSIPNDRVIGCATKQVTPLPPQYRSNRTRTPVMPSARYDPGQSRSNPNDRVIGYATKQVTPLPPQYRSNRTRTPVMPSARSEPVPPVRNRSIPARHPILLASKAITPLPPQYRQSYRTPDMPTATPDPVPSGGRDYLKRSATDTVASDTDSDGPTESDLKRPRSDDQRGPGVEE